MSVRVETRSPLDAVADGPQAVAYGITKRLHDVADRFAAVLRDAPFYLDSDTLAEVARRFDPQAEIADFTSRQAIRNAILDTLGHGPLFDRVSFALRGASVVALVALIERIEEVRLSD